jgi:hypothetical protein
MHLLPDDKVPKIKKPGEISGFLHVDDGYYCP